MQFKKSMYEIARIVTQTMQKNKITVEMIAQETDIPMATIKRIVNGQQTYGLNHLADLLDYVDCKGSAYSIVRDLIQKELIEAIED